MHAGQRTGTFLEASGVESLQLLGLSMQGCAKSAIAVRGAARLQLQAVELLGHNRDAEAESGGALLALDVEQLLLSGVTCSNNQAVVHGACVSVLRSQQVVIANSNFTYNTVEAETAKGGGAAVAIQLADSVTILNSSFSHNTAHGDNLDAGAAYLHTVKAANISGCSFFNNSADLHGGALFGNDVGSLSVSDSTFTRNGHLRLTATELDEFDGWPWVFAGGGLAVEGYEPVNVALRRCTFEGNAAESGGGVSVTQWGSLAGRLRLQDCFFRHNEVRSVTQRGSLAGWLRLQDCFFRHNEADLGAGVFMNENMGSTVNISSCRFVQNRGHFGGGAMAIYDSDATVINCTMDSNEVESEGGAMHVETEWAAGSGNSVVILGARFTNNTSGVTGGAVVVNGQNLQLQDSLFERNTANEEAGAVSVMWAQQVELRRVTLLNNTATSGSAGGISAGNTLRLAMHDVLLEGNKGPEGAGMHLQSVANATLRNTSFIGNTASRAGGGLAVLRSNLAIVSSSLSHNTAQLGGGIAADSSQVTLQDVVLDANAAALQPSTRQQQQQQQDSDEAGSATSVLQFASMMYAEGSAGGMLLQRSTLDVVDSQLTGNAADWDAGGLLLQQPGQFNISGSSFESNTARDGSGEAVDATSAGVTLDPVCPALGATVLEAALVSVDRFQVFGLPVHSLDQFNSRVTRGPGSDWTVALQQPQLMTLNSQTGSSSSSSNEGPLVQLLSAARGRLSGGHVVLEGLSIAAPPGSELSMQLTARSMQAGVSQALSTGIIVRVRPCLPGQTAVFSNTTSSSSSSSSSSSATPETCYLCAAPSFSFTAYANSSSSSISTGSSSSSSSSSSRRSAARNQIVPAQQARFGAAPATGACQRCPPHGLCIAGMVIPTQGCYQPHPRSAAIWPCPHTEACSRDANAVANLQGYQCAIRGVLDAAQIDARPFVALQCSKGYWGPFCSSCYRPGRNTWLQQPGQLGLNLQEDKNLNPKPQALRTQGYTIASRGVSLPMPQTMDYSEAYGRSSGRCSRCSHLLLAWVGFLLARLLDLLIILLLALLWTLLGALANSPAAAALDKLKRQQAKSLRFGDRALMFKVSTTLRHASMRHMSCLAQVLLDGAQIAALILTQDLMFRVPAWAAVGLSAVLLTQHSTWQWVAFECLLPGSSKASGVAVQAMVVMMLPVLYTAVLLLVLTQLRKVLALLVLVLAVPGVNAAVFGGVLLALLCVVMANAFVTLGSLVWRCATAVAPSTQQLQQPEV
ncbi:hypothetical protein OEZ85_007118 [Tetradesmus obliquus]|uniref:Right handed beta helix domain-containing protein n=1 Tax=Tetradesmus obliquus TaxID=3088 RepID=A0ABY8TXE6_TETOB|nr:hypothetical protein OEZ85_007118 [Tetradesmus obliquus]